MVFTYAIYVLAIVGLVTLLGLIHHVIDERLARREKQERMLRPYEGRYDKEVRP